MDSMDMIKKLKEIADNDCSCKEDEECKCKTCIVRGVLNDLNDTLSSVFEELEERFPKVKIRTQNIKIVLSEHEKQRLSGTFHLCEHLLYRTNYYSEQVIGNVTNISENEGIVSAFVEFTATDETLAHTLGIPEEELDKFLTTSDYFLARHFYSQKLVIVLACAQDDDGNDNIYEE